MFKTHLCTLCNQEFRFPSHGGARYKRWFQPSSIHTYCPNCGTEIEETEKSRFFSRLSLAVFFVYILLELFTSIPEVYKAIDLILTMAIIITVILAYKYECYRNVEINQSNQGS